MNFLKLSQYSTFFRMLGKVKNLAQPDRVFWCGEDGGVGLLDGHHDGGDLRVRQVKGSFATVIP